MEWYEYYKGSHLASGSYGDVYDVTYGSSGTVIKVLKQNYDDLEDKRRLQREIHCLKELLECDNVIDIIDCDEHAAFPWFLMPKADLTLHDYVIRNQGISEDECISFTKSILQALEYAHSREILHRDLGANNVLLFKEQDGFKVKVSDFSLGRDFRKQTRQLTRTSQSNLGQDAFVAPEQIENLNNATKQSDIYSVGSLMSFMLTGRDPRHFTPDSPLTPIIQQLRDIEPARRPQSANEVLRQLELYNVLTNRETRLQLEDIIHQFEASKKTFIDSGTLSPEARQDLTSYMTRQVPLYEGYNKGHVTYSNYFYPLITMPRELFVYWLRNIDQSSINRFLERFFQQLNLIRNQTGWTFRNMINIAKFLMVVFDENKASRARIFEELIITRERGFSEAYDSIIKIMTGLYDDQHCIMNLALIMNRYREDLRPIYSENVGKIRHAAFVGVFGY